MRYIGDLSAQDAALLDEFAKSHENILEFGSGGSTQIFAQAASPRAQITSVETDLRWVDRTRANLKRLGILRPVEFWSWKDWERSSSRATQYDLIFDDGIDKLRCKFAVRAWALLRVGGKFLFHDTRRPKDFRNVTALLNEVFLEVEAVQLNWRSSNITVLTKKVAQPWEDWNVVEKRERWEYGHAEPTPNLWGDAPPKG